MRKPGGAKDSLVTIPIAESGVRLEGLLSNPENSRGIVLFAHGSGSGRHSPRNNYVAEALQRAGMATLLFDLLTEAESEDRRNVFNIPLLAQRLLHATEWVRRQSALATLPIGYFGASTGAAAALMAAAHSEIEISAVVSRGGRPDLAGTHLARVRAPTLLIVGGEDTEVIWLNKDALSALNCPKELKIVPGATHLFEEPGTMEEVVRLATEWFSSHFCQEVHGEAF